MTARANDGWVRGACAARGLGGGCRCRRSRGVVTSCESASRARRSWLGLCTRDSRRLRRHVGGRCGSRLWLSGAVRCVAVVDGSAAGMGLKRWPHPKRSLPAEPRLYGAPVTSVLDRFVGSERGRDPDAICALSVCAFHVQRLARVGPKRWMDVRSTPALASGAGRATSCCCGRAWYSSVADLRINCLPRRSAISGAHEAGCTGPAGACSIGGAGVASDSARARRGTRA